MAALALVVPKVKPAKAKTPKVSKPGPGDRRGSSSGGKGRPRKLPKQGRYFPKPPEAGAKDVTLATFALRRALVVGALVLAVQAIGVWLLQNSKQRNLDDNGDPVGPPLTYTMPTGWGVRLSYYAGSTGFNVSPDMLHFRAENPYVDPEQYMGGLGEAFPAKIRIGQSFNDARWDEAEPGNITSGRSGYDVELLDQDGNITSTLPSGLYVNTFGPTEYGSYLYDYNRYVITLFDPAVGDQPFPGPGDFDAPPSVAQAPIKDLAAAPVLPPLPAPATDPPAVPDGQPVPAGVPSPVPGALPLRRTAPQPATSPAPARSAPLPVPDAQRAPAVGAPAPAPAPAVATTPKEVVRVGDRLIGGPGASPAPTLPAIATEVGRLEQKAEAILQGMRGADGPNLLERIIQTELENFIRAQLLDLFNDVPGGSFELIPPCPPPGGGDPLPPVVVPYDGASNPSLGILAKLDGIAGLIQAHKDMGQPTCQTVVYGDEVTVHFESDP
jgi:hypothetical protein